MFICSKFTSSLARNLAFRGKSLRKGAIIKHLQSNAIVKKGIVERLDAGEVIIGDGGFSFGLEKRGYVKAGQWTPECVVEHPEAVQQLHRDFLRAGADVMQAFTFSMQDDLVPTEDGKLISWDDVNNTACKLAVEVAKDSPYALASGSLCEIGTAFTSGKISKHEIQQKFKRQVDIFIKNGVDLLIAEYISHVQEAEWMVEVMRDSGKPTAVTLAIGSHGDRHGISPAECAIRLAQAGADIIGVNCRFDPEISLQTIQLMQEAVKKEGIKVHFMIQPLGYWTPEAGPNGFTSLVECPLAMEPRLLTRFDCHKFARKAYDMGIRYIGGCCGFEPYHIRALAEELAPERGRLPPGSLKSSPWGENLKNHSEPQMRAKASREFWSNLQPASGRPHSPAFCIPEEFWEFEKN